MSVREPTEAQIETAVEAHRAALGFHGPIQALPPETREQYRRIARAVLLAVGPDIAASALRDAANGIRASKDYGHWNLRSEYDPETAYSPDVWVERRADRIEKEARRG